MKTVKDVLWYLLERDRDAWRKNPFLCHRVTLMEEAGLIEKSLADSVKEFIKSKLNGNKTLIGLYLDETQDSFVTLKSHKWPSIRQSYLRQWIKELENEPD